MRSIGKQEFKQLTQGSTVLEADWFGPKVLQLSDGHYLKIFRIKRLITSARIFPYAKRFERNVLKLKELAVPTVRVIDTFNITFLKKRAVLYAPLVGETLRSAPTNMDGDLCHQLGQFIATLHEKGIYFRSLHLGNIVKTPEGALGLIDIADMKFFRKPLSPWRRKGNLKHFSRYPEDKGQITTHLAHFIQGYQQIAGSQLPLQEWL